MAKNFQMNDYVNYTSKPIANCVHFHYFVSLLLSSRRRHKRYCGLCCYGDVCCGNEKLKGFWWWWRRRRHCVWGGKSTFYYDIFFASAEIVKFCMGSSRQPDYHSPSILPLWFGLTRRMCTYILKCHILLHLAKAKATPRIWRPLIYVKRKNDRRQQTYAGIRGFSLCQLSAVKSNDFIREKGGRNVCEKYRKQIENTFTEKPTWHKKVRTHSMTSKRHNMLIIPNGIRLQFQFNEELTHFYFACSTQIWQFAFDAISQHKSNKFLHFLFRFRYVKHKLDINASAIRCIFKFSHKQTAIGTFASTSKRTWSNAKSVHLMSHASSNDQNINDKRHRCHLVINEYETNCAQFNLNYAWIRRRTSLLAARASRLPGSIITINNIFKINFERNVLPKSGDTVDGA